MPGGLWAIRLLQALPQSARFRQRLSDCAVHEVLDRKLDPTLPGLGILDILGFGKKISLAPSFLSRRDNRVNAPVHANELARTVAAPSIIYGVKFGEHRQKSLH